MQQEKIEKLLNDLSKHTEEPVNQNLAYQIKQHIPDALSAHRSGLRTFRIIIDLRVGKLVTAAAIIATLILCTAILNRSDTSGSLLEDGKFLLNYVFGTRKTSSGLSSDISIEGKEVVYYGDNIDWKDPNALVMHWKVSDGQYRAMFSNSKIQMVTADELIKLQAEMLKKKGK
jgi:hypothetical protein